MVANTAHQTTLSPVLDGAAVGLFALTFATLAALAWQGWIAPAGAIVIAVGIAGAATLAVAGRRAYRASLAAARETARAEARHEAFGAIAEALESMPCALAIFDADGREVITNDSFLALAAAEKAPLAGMPLLGEPDGERRLANDRWLRQSNRALPGGETLVALVDLSEQKRRDRVAQEAKERFSLAMHAANEALWEWNLLTGERTLSPRIADLFHLPTEEGAVSASLWQSRVHPDDVAGYQRHLDDHLDGGSSVFRFEYRVRGDDDVYRWAVDRGLALRDGTGRAYRMAGSIGEISERKRGEQALKEAKETAEMASRAKTEFLANMSHELRTPLNAVIGFSEIIKKEMFGPVGVREYKDYAADINASGLHLLELINDILDMSKAEAGKLDLHESPVMLPKAAASCLRLIEERAAIGGVHIVNRLPDDLSPLWADERRVKQLLINLLSNAVKFTPQGGSVTIESEIHGDGALTVAVADTGIGMSPDDVQRALRPFEQIDASLDRRFEGTGLGLPIVKSLIELHGGKLEIESEVGVGTRVSLRFPAERLTCSEVRQPRLSVVS